MNKSSWRSERDLNSGPPNCKSGAQTPRPGCLLLKRRKTLETFHGLLISKKVALGSVSQVYCLAMHNLCKFEILSRYCSFTYCLLTGQLTTGVQIRAWKNNFEITKGLHCQAIYLTYKTKRHFLTNQESVKCFQFPALDNDCKHYSNSDRLIEPQDCVVIGLSAINIFLCPAERDLGDRQRESQKSQTRQLFACITLFRTLHLYSHSLNTDKTQ